jgi:5-bromo-4-chloroindolyl phosphate hydrolysis protein
MVGISGEKVAADLLKRRKSAMIPRTGEFGMPKKESAASGANWIGASIVAAALFAALIIFTGNLALAAAGAVAGLVAGFLIFKRKPDADISLVSSGITPEMVAEALKEGRAQVADLRSIGLRVANPLVQFKVKQIADVADKILDDIKQDPADLKAARPFLNYYLDSTVKILERYAEISSKKVIDKDVAQSLKRVEDLLDAIRLSFHKQLAKLQENDMLDLDTEMSVLERTMKLDGGDFMSTDGDKQDKAAPLA